MVIFSRQHQPLLASLRWLQSAEHRGQQKGAAEEALWHTVQLQVHLVLHRQVGSIVANCFQFSS